MENLEIIPGFGSYYKGKKVLVTGNTGFKGSWLAEWLTLLGAEVIGLSLHDGVNDQHYNLLQTTYKSYVADITVFNNVLDIFEKEKPALVFHLAAQALVLPSYENPILTYQTNVMGSLHLLEASKRTNVETFIMVTSDKCYENKEWVWGYRENEPFGGHDIYSSSKGCAELLTQSFRKSFCTDTNQMKIASVRAGNVIGGGDFSSFRIVPDLIQAAVSGSVTKIRSPHSTRPWQHVLEPLSGYLTLCWKLSTNHFELCDGWNFGPNMQSNATVLTLIDKASSLWSSIRYALDSDAQKVHEATLLMLDCSKAKHRLNWEPVWNLEQTIGYTINWYKEWHLNNTIISHDQIKKYITEARFKNLEWAQ